MAVSDRVKTDLRSLPGIGPSLERDLLELGVGAVTDLRGADPQALYDRLRLMRGGTMDRCVLYAFRCAVYAAEHDQPDPDLLKWWNWKDPVPMATVATRSR